jgi:hypothetical protein
MKEWGAFQHLIVLVFATTNSNTGRFQGAATSNEKKH